MAYICILIAVLAFAPSTNSILAEKNSENLAKMQAIKEKLNDMKEMRKAKAEAKEEEKAEKELAKARVEVAHEVRMAREAEAAMDLHVQKAAEKAADHERKYPSPQHGSGGSDQDVFGEDIYAPDSRGRIASSPSPGYSADPIYGCGAYPAASRDTSSMDSTATAAGTRNIGSTPTHNNLL